MLQGIKNDLEDVHSDVHSYFEESEAYLQLKVFKVITGMVTSSVQWLLVGVVTIISLLILSIAAAVAIGQALGEYYQGFLVVGGILLFVTYLCYWGRNRINSSLLRTFSRYYFE
ncbi:hypothetical protein PP178_11045 [Zeaxanthinibacter sp. PT1]|uniref:hypothetical protein n=1 Tax=Zeaxanthinibacter TaxID=561554 RepID=UPI00234B8CE0|nr:hypothetical protein [Zeaxanthinibacter sp. PT1]MDC6352090.1 hypothetical protein [Zeaxanthinibacter sp. PT1]